MLVEMSDSSTSRTYELVEELRAEIDFELEDVITEIVRELPEDYFQRIKHADQIVHLKALLALSFCKLQEELMFRSSDGVHVAVIARQNYSGQLANILSRLPNDQALVGAKIFTSRSHNFIIDLFEFAVAVPSANDKNSVVQSMESAAQEMAEKLDEDVDKISQFLSHYAPNSQILERRNSLAEHFLTYQQLCQASKPAVRLSKAENDGQIKLTVASRRLDARGLVFRVAEYLGQQGFDIAQAYLNDLITEDQDHVAIASFLIDAQTLESFSPHEQTLTQTLEKSVQ